jgi:hypothetical protein
MKILLIVSLLVAGCSQANLVAHARAEAELAHVRQQAIECAGDPSCPSGTSTYLNQRAMLLQQDVIHTDPAVNWGGWQPISSFDQLHMFPVL